MKCVNENHYLLHSVLERNSGMNRGVENSLLTRGLNPTNVVR